MGRLMPPAASVPPNLGRHRQRCDHTTLLRNPKSLDPGGSASRQSFAGCSSHSSPNHGRIRPASPSDRRDEPRLLVDGPTSAVFFPARCTPLSLRCWPQNGTRHALGQAEVNVSRFFASKLVWVANQH